MKELAIDVSQYGTPEGIEENVSFSTSLGLPELVMAPCRNGGKFIICGSGPSIQNHLEDIRQDQKDGYPICAIKGTYDFLIDNGIIPDLYVSVEPRYRPIKNPNKRSVFLLATRCHQDIFKELKDHTIVIWHSWSNQEAPLCKGRLAIGGGSTSGLRAVNIAYILGFLKIKMYGMDSCLGERGEKRINQDPLPDHIQKTDVVVGDKTFICNMAMAAQAQDFQMIYQIMPDITIDVIGGGLLAAIIEERKLKGSKT